MNRTSIGMIIIGVALTVAAVAAAYPPAVGILGQSPKCLSCHVNNGSWVDGPDLIIDIIDKQTDSSLRQPDGSFLLSAKRGQPTTVLTVIGYRARAKADMPYRNAWLYVDTATIDSPSLSKFPAGWEVNLPMACRLVGDKLPRYPNAQLTVLPMTVRPTAAAADGSVTLQVMLTKGEAVKGKAKEGMRGSYFERQLRLKVID